MLKDFMTEALKKFADLFISKVNDYGLADFGDRVVYDEDVIAFAKSHMRFFDRFSFEKIGEAVLVAATILYSDDKKAIEDTRKWDWL